jgi:hypothetical protein
VEEDSGQATPLLSKGFVDDIMAGLFAIRESKTILARYCDAQPTEWQHIGN